MKTYDVSNASVSSITSVSEIISSTSENAALGRRELRRPANIVIITQPLLTEIRDEGTRKRRPLLRPGHREAGGDLPQLARRRCHEGGESTVERKALREVRGEPLGREGRGEAHRLHLRGVGLEVV